jgi:hypothetical protein
VQIVAVKFEQVEGIEERAGVVAPIPDSVERRDPVLPAVGRHGQTKPTARAAISYGLWPGTLWAAGEMTCGAI